MPALFDIGTLLFLKRYIREPFCGLSHFIGAGLSVLGLVLLLIAAHGRPWHTVSYSIYGLTLISLYTSSGLYHSLKVSPRAEFEFMRVDHLNIFLLIAGSCTPVCLVPLRGPWGWSLFGIEWGIAVLGISSTYLWKNRPHWVRITLYIIMGWLVAGTLSPLRASVPEAGLLWLVSGGLFYTVGAAVFALDRPHLWPGKFSAHDLWHVFVLAGSACHFYFIYHFISAIPS
jgi:hemolysin III